MKWGKNKQTRDSLSNHINETTNQKG